MRAFWAGLGCGQFVPEMLQKMAPIYTGSTQQVILTCVVLDLDHQTACRSLNTNSGSTS